MLFKFAWTHSPTVLDVKIKKLMETGGMLPKEQQCHLVIIM